MLLPDEAAVTARLCRSGYRAQGRSSRVFELAELASYDGSETLVQFPSVGQHIVSPLQSFLSIVGQLRHNDPGYVQDLLLESLKELEELHSRNSERTGFRFVRHRNVLS